MNQQVQPHYEDDFDLSEILRVLKESWKLIIALLLIGVVVAGSITAFFVPIKYRSYAIFTLEAGGSSNSSSFNSTFGQVNAVKEVIHSHPFLREILEKAGMKVDQQEIERLRSAIAIGTTKGKNIRLEVIWDDPRQAYELLNLVYNIYQVKVAERINVYNENRLRVAEENFVRSQELFEEVNKALVDFQKRNKIVLPPPDLAVAEQDNPTFRILNVSPEQLTEYNRLAAEHTAAKENYIKSYNMLEETRQSIKAEESYLFVTVEPPVFSGQKYSPSMFNSMVIAGFLALFIGVMLAFLREYLKKNSLKWAKM